MNDLISRQAAKNRKVYSDERHEYVVPVAEIDWLPPAQPDGDLISRRRAINITWEDTIYTDPLNVLTDVREKIKALPSAQPEQQWTPCSEDLPKKTDFYLVTVKDWNIPQQTDFFNSHDKKWDTFGDRVIAWQPLPEPYKET